MHRRAVTFFAALLSSSPAFAQLRGEVNAHDPSSVVKSGSTFYYYATGPGVISRSSTDLVNWVAGPNVFATPPAWVRPAVPGFTDVFWAPDVVFRNNQYYLYYSASTFGSQRSGIGVATSPTLNPSAPNYGFVDQGPVIQSVPGQNYNAIDASVLNDANGRMWMTFGSYWNGIYLAELNPTTGKRLNETAAPTRLAGRTGGATDIEASQLIQRNGYYYLFVNYGSCCSGVDSTYDVHVGRSAAVDGPYLDKNGVAMTAGGGSLFLDDDGSKIGPGHFALLPGGVTGTGRDSYGFHYYDGNRDGAPTYGRGDLYWTADLWPSVAPVNPDWSGAANLNWSNPGNWSGGTVPDGVGSVANFAATASNRRAVSIDAGVGRTVSRINFSSPDAYVVGAAAGQAITLDAMAGDAQATINVSAGSHQLRAPLRTADELGVNVTRATSTLTLSGDSVGRTIQKYGHGTLVLAGASHVFDGSIFVRNGTLVVDGAASSTRFNAVGQTAGDVATLVVRGSGALAVDADLNVGDTGNADVAATGTLELSGAARVTLNAAAGLYVGSGFAPGSRAVGVVNQSGGTLVANGNFDGAFVIGGRNSALGVGTYNFSGGTVDANTNVHVGGRGTGAVNQTGGTFDAGGFVSIGRHAGSTGTWTIRDATLDHSNAAALLIVGESGVGTLDVNAGGVVTTRNALRLGHATGGSGTVNLNAGGTIGLALASRGPGAASLNLNGGTLRATADATDFLQLGAANVEVLAGGAIVDTDGHTVTLAKPLDGAGGLTKRGAGTLTLGVAQAFRGGVRVEAGTLRARRLAGNGALTVAGGAAELLAPTTPFDPAQRSTVDALAIDAGPNSGSLDVGLNLLVIDHAAGTASPAAGVRAMLADGRLRAAAMTAGQAIGYADAASFAATSTPAAFGTVDATALLVRVTRAGDFDLDGAVAFADLVALAQRYGSGGTHVWRDGDANYDGAVDFADLVVVAQNYGGTLSSVEVASLGDSFGASFAGDWALAQTLVPEPTSLVAIAATLVTASARRRERVATRDG